MSKMDEAERFNAEVKDHIEGLKNDQDVQATDAFEVDKDTESKILITVAPDGYLRLVRD